MRQLDSITVDAFFAHRKPRLPGFHGPIILCTSTDHLERDLRRIGALTFAKSVALRYFCSKEKYEDADAELMVRLDLEKTKKETGDDAVGGGMIEALPPGGAGAEKKDLTWYRDPRTCPLCGDGLYVSVLSSSTLALFQTDRHDGNR